MDDIYVTAIELSCLWETASTKAFMGVEEKGEAALSVVGSGQLYVLPRYPILNRPWLKVPLTIHSYSWCTILGWPSLSSLAIADVPTMLDWFSPDSLAVADALCWVGITQSGFSVCNWCAQDVCVPGIIETLGTGIRKENYSPFWWLKTPHVKPGIRQKLCFPLGRENCPTLSGGSDCHLQRRD